MIAERSEMEPKTCKGSIVLPKLDGFEIIQGIYLIGEPTPRPDLGKTALACLANINGMLGVVELSIKLEAPPPTAETPDAP